MIELPDPVQWAVPVFIVTIVIEAWWLWKRRRDRFDAKDMTTSILLGVGSLLAGALVAGAVAGIAAFAWQYRLIDIPLWGGWAWLAWPLCLLLDDLAYYVFHRSAHRVRWFWASHVVHHGSERYNLTTAVRQTWTGFLSLTFLFRLPLFLIGFPPAMVFFVAGVNLLYQYWIHTETIDRLPRWFEAVFNTPSHHRVHHGRNPLYLDANYAGIFIIWDRMFGSFVEERRDEPVDYGLVKPLGSHNVFYAAFHEWLSIAADMWRAPWRHKLGYLLREPGWSHDGSRETSAMIRARAGLPEKHETAARAAVEERHGDERRPDRRAQL